LSDSLRPGKRLERQTVGTYAAFEAQILK